MNEILYNFLFKKRVLKEKERKKELYHRINDLKSEKIIIEKDLQFQKSRFQRIEYLLNNRVNPNSKCNLIKTKNKTLILIAVNENEYEIEIFDIDNKEYNSNRAMVLYARERIDEMYIQDIQGGNGNGHGEVAIKTLIKYAKKKSKKRIIGKLSIVDFDHKERLIAFYKKMGFETDLKNMKIELKI